MTKFDLIIFGAGPIGLTLANLLGKKDFKILVIDKTKELVFNTNRYIAISNKTNKILNQDILKKKFLQIKLSLCNFIMKVLKIKINLT